MFRLPRLSGLFCIAAEYIAANTEVHVRMYIGVLDILRDGADVWHEL